MWANLSLLSCSCCGKKYPEGDTYYYKKAGVMVWDITPDEAVQTYLFDSVDRQKQSALAEAVDRINRKTVAIQCV